METHGTPTLLPEGATVEAILYCFDDPSSYDTKEVERAAEALGFEVTSSFGPDPDGAILEQVIQGAKNGGAVTTLLVPYGRSLGVKSPEDFLNRAGYLASNGLRLVAVLESDIVDTDDPKFIRTVQWSTNLRSEGIRRGTKDWAAGRKERGEKLGRSPRCANCDHGVVRKLGTNGGHLTMPDGTIGRCFKSGCPCGNYVPRNDKMMGARKS